MPEGNPTSATARHHERVRRQHQRELAQDYVEAIYSLSYRQAVVRVVDLQGVFGVSHVTVIRSLGRLEEQGFIHRPAQGGVALTERGREVAEQAYRRHQLVQSFLEKLGVGPAAAAADAEGIEHHLSPETLAAFQRFLDEA